MDNIRNFFSGRKIVFVILGIILFVEVIYTARVLILPTPPPLSSNRVAQKTIAKISLNVPKLNFNINETIPVMISINTGSHTISGADLLIHYDAKIIEASTGGIIKGKTFDEYPLMSVDANKALISISGVSSLNKSFSGIGQFATLYLKGKVSGKTALTIDFKKGVTTNSNLTEASTSLNILEQVDNLVLNIQ